MQNIAMLHIAMFSCRAPLTSMHRCAESSPCRVQRHAGHNRTWKFLQRSTSSRTESGAAAPSGPNHGDTERTSHRFLSALLSRRGALSGAPMRVSTVRLKGSLAGKLCSRLASRSPSCSSCRTVRLRASGRLTRRLVELLPERRVGPDMPADRVTRASSRVRLPCAT